MFLDKMVHEGGKEGKRMDGGSLMARRRPAIWATHATQGGSGFLGEASCSQMTALLVTISTRAPAHCVAAAKFKSAGGQRSKRLSRVAKHRLPGETAPLVFHRISKINLSPRSRYATRPCLVMHGKRAVYPCFYLFSPFWNRSSRSFSRLRSSSFTLSGGLSSIKLLSLLRQIGRAHV